MVLAVTTIPHADGYRTLLHPLPLLCRQTRVVAGLRMVVCRRLLFPDALRLLIIAYTVVVWCIFYIIRNESLLCVTLRLEHPFEYCNTLTAFCGVRTC